ncbi:hypothetical protein ColTof4_07243 [Colletotrichum tofieldiae]|nr:hypothetical protein ColTof3_12184 [Colletotrichum tofieldiae]GKT74820.1 hypothetical protein ColTof4_07243 [Colletotrichum tofieldiae]GKT92019.1 hypothetical protein Ct61P_09869 [Colletotrichum tofieldiae]
MSCKDSMALTPRIAVDPVAYTRMSLGIIRDSINDHMLKGATFILTMYTTQGHTPHTVTRSFDKATNYTPAAAGGSRKDQQHQRRRIQGEHAR